MHFTSEINILQKKWIKVYRYASRFKCISGYVDTMHITYHLRSIHSIKSNISINERHEINVYEIISLITSLVYLEDYETFIRDAFK